MMRFVSEWDRRHGRRNGIVSGISTRTSRLMVAAAFAGLGCTTTALAGDVYWDVNGTAAGSGVSTFAPDWVGGSVPGSPAMWDPGSTTNWNTDSGGGAGTLTGDIGAGNTGNFSAGSDANTSYFIEIPDGVNMTAGGLAVNQGGTVIIAGYGNGGIGGPHGGNSANLLNIGSGTFNVDVPTGSSLYYGYTFANPSFSGSGTIVKTGGGMFFNNGDEADLAPGTFTGKYDVQAGTMGLFYGANSPNSELADEGSYVPDELKVSNNAVIETFEQSTSAKIPANAGITIGSGGGTFHFAGRKGLDPGFSITQIGSVLFGSAIVGGSEASRVPITIQSEVWDTSGTGFGQSQGGSGALPVNNSSLYAKWILNGGELNLTAGDAGLGAVPASPLADAITLDNTHGGDGRVGGANLVVRSNVTIPANRGITLGSGGGGLHPYFATAAGGGGPSTLTVNSVITGSGQLRVFLEGGANAVANCRVILTGANNYSGGTWITGVAGSAPKGTLQGDTTSLQGDIINDTGGTLDFDQTFDGSYAGSISGGGALQKNSSGVVYFTGTNTYTDTTTINGGALIANSTASLPGYNTSGKVTVNSGGTVGASAGGAGQWSSTEIDTLRTTTTFNAGSSFGINVDTSNSFTYNSSITQPVNFVKFGNGSLTLGGANTYSGTTTILAGTLRVAGGAAIPDASAVTIANTAGATLDLNGTSETIGSLAGGGTTGGSVNLNGTLTTGGLNTSTVFAGVISGSGTLIKTGTGNMEITPQPTANSAALNIGTLTVNGNGNGKLTIAARSGSGNHPVYVNSLNLGPTGGETGTLDLNDNDLVVNNGDFNTIQSLVLDGYSSSVNASKVGIISTVSQTTGGKTILELVDNSLVGDADWPVGSGNTIGASAIIGKYTYFGDTNLDGQVTGDDYSAVDANLGTTPAAGEAILKGDTNFDGQVTGDDYSNIDANLGLGVGNPLAPGHLSAVPEPASLSLIGLGAAGLLARRRRRRKV